jgi:hypothetical protein
MKGPDQQVLQMGVRVKGFLDMYADKIGSAVAPIARKRLDVAVAALTAYDSDQHGSIMTAIGETAQQKEMRSDIYREYLTTIGTIAKMEGINEPSLVMYSRVDQQGQFLVELRALAVVATKYEHVWKEYGLTADFFAGLQAATDALEASMNSRAGHWTSRSTATGGLGAASKAIKAEVKMIGFAVRFAGKNDAALLAGWSTASKIHKTTIEPRRGGDLQLPPEDENPA